MFICRLGDPWRQGRNANLTLETLVVGGAAAVPEYKIALEGLLECFRDKTEKFRELRNKIYGHTDYETAFEAARNLYSRAEMEDALVALREFMSSYRRLFGMEQLGYEHVITPSNGEGMISTLRRKRAAIKASWD